jgi:hypothetical protein
VKTWIILGCMAALLISCGGTPTAAAIGHGTMVGYTETDGAHVTDITLHSHAAGQVGPSATMGYAHEGERVDILETADGGDSLRVRTPSGIEGWTQIDFVKR